MVYVWKLGGSEGTPERDKAELWKRLNLLFIRRSVVWAGGVKTTRKANTILDCIALSIVFLLVNLNK
jgi:hypothetical protein